MPVIGINITKMEGKREKPVDKQLEVKSNTNIKKVVDIDIPAFNRKGLGIQFEFTVNYLGGQEKYGKIEIGGDVVYIDPNQDKIVKEWETTKKLPKATNLEIINAILRKSVLKSLWMSEELGLPAPIALPFASDKTPVEKRPEKK